MEALIKRRGERMGARVPVRLRLIEMVIDIPPHRARFPVEAKDVEVVRKISLRQRVAGTLGRVALRRVAVVERAVHLVRLVTEEFHDVDLAAVRPAAVAFVGGHHPDGGPDAFSFGQFGADVEPPIRPIALEPCANAGGGVIARAFGPGVMFPARFDEKKAVSHAGVVGDIVLQFVVAAAARVHLKLPLRGVEGVAVEFVIPNKRPAGRSVRRAGRANGEEDRGDKKR